MNFEEALKRAVNTRTKPPFNKKQLTALGFTHSEKLTSQGKPFPNLKTEIYTLHFPQECIIEIRITYTRKSSNTLRFDYNGCKTYFFISGGGIELKKIQGTHALSKFISTIKSAI